MAGAAAAGGIAYRLIGADERNAHGTETTIEREILRTFDEMAAAAERMDADALFQFVRDNQRGALVTSGRVLMTRADALAETRRGFEGVASLKYRFGSRHITLLSPDAAIVVADVTSEGTTQDGRSFSVPFVQTVILTRDQNGWRVLHTHQSTARGSR